MTLGRHVMASGCCGVMGLAGMLAGPFWLRQWCHGADGLHERLWRSEGSGVVRELGVWGHGCCGHGEEWDF